ncbi:MAG: VOC family protein [Myxococcota bacterium]
MAYVDNGFCWHGIVSPSPERAVAFYPEVLGWSVQPVPMGSAEVQTFVTGEVGRAHLASPAQGEAPSWNHYLRVDDVDARTKVAEANGGRVQVPPTDIAVGRFSVVTSPSGAAFHLFHEAREAESENAPGGPGAVHWVELWSRDLDADVTWLSASFGFEAKSMNMPNGPYILLEHNGVMRGGAMATEDTPAHWLAWVHVPNVDEAFARATNHGGTALTEPFDVPTVGRMAVIADPDGARFGIITPTP